MLSDICQQLLQRHVEMKGRKRVLEELGISSATLSQVLSDKYGASTDAVEARIINIYGHGGKVQCPILGPIDPGRCAVNHKRAQCRRIAGNPRTIRLYLACRKCDLRN
jgi:hypothetical protein